MPVTLSPRRRFQAVGLSVLAVLALLAIAQPLRSLVWRADATAPPCPPPEAFVEGDIPADLLLAPPPSSPRTSVLGVHTRLTDEVEAWKIRCTLDLARAMGATWIVEYVPWAYVETEPGVYRWEHTDLIMDHARRLGLRVIARIDMVPQWARPPETTTRYLPDESFEPYARFVAAFARRYGDVVGDVVVWNEPNLDFEWGFRPVDPAAYTRLLQTTYRHVKDAAPSVRVVAAGLAPTVEESPRALMDIRYLEAMYQHGAGRFFDALAVHTYGWTAPPEEPPDPYKVNFRRVELLRQVMVAHGDAAKPVLITETGWNDHPRWTKAVRPSQRIQYSLRALDYAVESWPWVDSMSFWMFRLPRPARNYNDYYTFVGVDFALKPIYRAVREWAAAS